MKRTKTSIIADIPEIFRSCAFTSYLNCAMKLDRQLHLDPTNSSLLIEQKKVISLCKNYINLPNILPNGSIDQYAEIYQWIRHSIQYVWENTEDGACLWYENCKVYKTTIDIINLLFSHKSFYPNAFFKSHLTLSSIIIPFATEKTWDAILSHTLLGASTFDSSDWHELCESYNDIDFATFEEMFSRSWFSHQIPTTSRDNYKNSTLIDCFIRRLNDKPTENNKLIFKALLQTFDINETNCNWIDDNAVQQQINVLSLCEYYEAQPAIRLVLQNPSMRRNSDIQEDERKYANEKKLSHMKSPLFKMPSPSNYLKVWRKEYMNTGNKYIFMLNGCKEGVKGDHGAKTIANLLPINKMRRILAATTSSVRETSSTILKGRTDNTGCTMQYMTELDIIPPRLHLEVGFYGIQRDCDLMSDFKKTMHPIHSLVDNDLFKPLTHEDDEYLMIITEQSMFRYITCMAAMADRYIWWAMTNEPPNSSFQIITILPEPNRRPLITTLYKTADNLGNQIVSSNSTVMKIPNNCRA